MRQRGQRAQRARQAAAAAGQRAPVAFAFSGDGRSSQLPKFPVVQSARLLRQEKERRAKLAQEHARLEAQKAERVKKQLKARDPRCGCVDWLCEICV